MRTTLNKDYMILELMENTTAVMCEPTLPIIAHYKLPNTCFSSIFWLFELVNTPCMDTFSLPVILSLVLSEKYCTKTIEKVNYI